MRDQAIRLDPTPLRSEWAAHLTMLRRVQQLADRFDVLHFHLDPLHFPLFEDLATRALTTLHGRLDLKDYIPLLELRPQYPLISISLDQRAPLTRANWVGNVPHGIPRDLYRPTMLTPGGYLAFLGRMSPEKRPDAAIRIAKRAGVPLKSAAKVDNADVDYFRDSIRPLLDDPLIEFVGKIGGADKQAFLGGALALLFPIDWPEPFGLVMIEAMACGTPVIAWNRGSVPEVIDEGITGKIVDSDQQAIDAIEWARIADRVAAEVSGRPRHADFRSAHWPLSLCRHPVVFHRVRSRCDRHRDADALAGCGHRPRGVALPRPASGNRDVGFPGCCAGQDHP
jgi:glycosyltransferase involved in cell wall biosynthesis